MNTAYQQPLFRPLRRMGLLRAVYYLQAALMWPAWVAFVSSEVTVYTSLLVVYLFPIGMIFTLIAGWQAIRRPELRRLSLMTVATPIFCLSTPFFLSAFQIGPLPQRLLVVFAVAASIILALGIIHKSGIGRRATNSQLPRIDRHLFWCTSAALLLLWLPIMGWLFSGQPTGWKNFSEELISSTLIYYSIVGVIGACLAIFTMLYAIVGLVKNSERRGIHLMQLFIAGITLATLLVLFSLTMIAFANPG